MRAVDGNYYFLEIRLPKSSMVLTSKEDGATERRTTTLAVAPEGQAIPIYSAGDSYLVSGTISGTVTTSQIYRLLVEGGMNLPGGATPELERLLRQNRRMVKLLIDSMEREEVATKQPAVPSMPRVVEDPASCEEAAQKMDRQDPNVQTLIRAVSEGNVGRVQESIASGADVNAQVEYDGVKGWTLLMEAARAGRLEIVDVLLQAKANPNARNQFCATAVDIAMATGHRTVAKRLFDRGAKGRDWSALPADGADAIPAKKLVK
jgi:ankyrin repeat protein